jgi:hypothetical protein
MSCPQRSKMLIIPRALQKELCMNIFDEKYKYSCEWSRYEKERFSTV